MNDLDIVRFWSKVNMDGPCWLWTAGTFPDGYGQFKIGGKPRGAHRVAYELRVGPIPSGMHVCHRCDVPGCVNPTHLFLGTNLDNIADRNAKHRQAFGARNGMYTKPERRASGCRSGRHTKPERNARGERNGRAKLTDEQVATIRIWHANGMSFKAIAHEFAISGVHAARICRGENRVPFAAVRP